MGQGQRCARSEHRQRPTAQSEVALALGRESEELCVACMYRCRTTAAALPQPRHSLRVVPGHVWVLPSHPGQPAWQDNKRYLHALVNSRACRGTGNTSAGMPQAQEQGPAQGEAPCCRPTRCAAIPLGARVHTGRPDWGQSQEARSLGAVGTEARGGVEVSARHQSGHGAAGQVCVEQGRRRGVVNWGERKSVATGHGRKVYRLQKGCKQADRVLTAAILLHQARGGPGQHPLLDAGRQAVLPGVVMQTRGGAAAWSILACAAGGTQRHGHPPTAPIVVTASPSPEWSSTTQTSLQQLWAIPCVGDCGCDR